MRTRQHQGATAVPLARRDDPPGAMAAAVIALQRTAGNRAVTGLLGRRRLQRSGHGPPPPITGVSLDHDRVSIPPPAHASVHVRPVPAGAAPTWSLADGRAHVDASTSVDAHGVVTVGAGQSPGDIQVQGTDASGTAFQTLFLPESPSGIASTRDAGPLASAATVYGADFEHALTAPSGDVANLDHAHVNERFAGAPNPGGTTHAITGTPFGTFVLNSNDPSSARAGWDIDASGTLGPDHIGIGKSMIRASDFVRSASNPSPNTLPASFTVTQGLHVLQQPTTTYATSPFATPDHVRGLRSDGSGGLEVFVSSNALEHTDPYDGPPAFTNARADPASVQVSPPTPPTHRGAPPPPPPTPNTVQISVDTVPAVPPTGHDPRFSIHGNSRGCHIDAVTGLLTIGTQPGTVTVRARDQASSNPAYDEVTVTVTPPPASSTP